MENHKELARLNLFIVVFGISVRLHSAELNLLTKKIPETRDIGIMLMLKASLNGTATLKASESELQAVINPANCQKHNTI